MRVDAVSTLLLPLLALLTLSAADEEDFQMKFTVDSLDSDDEAWRNVGSLGADGDIVSLTGTIATTSTNADDEIRAMCFSEAQSAVTFIDYDTNSNVNPQLTMEVWIQPTADDGSKDWLLGHDNGGYDRAIIARDSRYGGIAMGIGASYTSTVSYAAVSQWTHIVATFSKSEGVAKLYKNGGVAKGGEEQTVSIRGDSGSGESQIGLNGLKNYGAHNFVGCFARVQITNRVVEADEVEAMFDEFDAVINQADPCDDAQCEDPFICDADADQFDTVSDAQYPCKRDCDLFAVDEYLDQCSAVFPAAIETVTASISRVNESVLQITSVDIPAVTARVQLNEDAVTTINTELGSVETLIAALNDVDAATDSRVTLNEDAVTAMNSELSSVETSIEALNEVDTATDSRIVAVMALAESNEETAGSLEERLTFLERRIAGFEASDVSAAKSADGQLDVGGELFGSTAQLPYKDELIGALVATNLITMAGFVCFAMTKRCNAKHKYVSVMDDEESDREKLNI